MAECAQLRSLPAGKDFHVFFSYRNLPEDQEWTRNAIRELELNGFKCCDHEIEFIAGKEILENIKDFMNRSIKTVLVFSKEYIESYYCKLEVQYSLNKGFIEKKHILIPVKREECDLPVDMKFRTCIDATKDVEVWLPHLINSIEAPENKEFTQPLLRIHDYKNFDTIFEEVSTASCCGAAYQRRFIPDYLRQSSEVLNPENFSRLVQELSSSRLVRQRMCINPSWPICVCMGFLIPVTVGAGTSNTVQFATGYYTQEDWPFSLLGIVFLVCALLLGIVWPCYCIYANKKGKSEMRLLLDGINRDMLISNVFITYTKMNATVTITFLYYEVKPCLEFIKAQRQSLSSDTRLQVISEFEPDEEDAPLIESTRCETDDEEECLQILLDISFEYFQKFLTGKLTSYGQYRHTERATCLCQYAEQKNRNQRGHNSIIEV